MFEGRREVGEGLVEVVAEDECVELREARAFRFELLAVDVLYPHVCDAANDNKQQLEKKLRDGKGRGERGERRGAMREGGRKRVHTWWVCGCTGGDRDRGPPVSLDYSVSAEILLDFLYTLMRKCKEEERRKGEGRRRRRRRQRQRQRQRGERR